MSLSQPLTVCWPSVYLLICLFWAALGLHCGAQASHWLGEQALGAQASVVAARWLGSYSSRAQ